MPSGWAAYISAYSRLLGTAYLASLIDQYVAHYAVFYKRWVASVDTTLQDLKAHRQYSEYEKGISTSLYQLIFADSKFEVGTTPK